MRRLLVPLLALIVLFTTSQSGVAHLASDCRAGQNVVHDNDGDGDWF